MSAQAESNLDPTIDIDLHGVRSRLANLRMSSVDASSDLLSVLATPPASEDLRSIQVVELCRVSDQVGRQAKALTAGDGSHFGTTSHL